MHFYKVSHYRRWASSPKAHCYNECHEIHILLTVIPSCRSIVGLRVVSEGVAIPCFPPAKTPLELFVAPSVAPPLLHVFARLPREESLGLWPGSGSNFETQLTDALRWMNQRYLHRRRTIQYWDKETMSARTPSGRSMMDGFWLVGQPVKLGSQHHASQTPFFQKGSLA